MLIELLAATAAVTDIPNPVPNWNGPGLAGLLLVVGWVFAIALVLCVLGGIVSGAAIGVGKAIDNGQLQQRGLGGLVGSVIGVAACAVIVIVLNFVFNAFGG